METLEVWGVETWKRSSSREEYGGDNDLTTGWEGVFETNGWLEVTLGVADGKWHVRVLESMQWPEQSGIGAGRKALTISTCVLGWSEGRLTKEKIFSWKVTFREVKTFLLEMSK